jgi:HlyD family secretion protein
VIQPGMELFRLIRDEQLEWLAELPAPALAQVQAGATARVQLDDGRVVPATVRLVAPTLDPHSRRGLAHVALPRGVALKAGGHASGEILVGDAQAMTLPESVIFVRDGESYVMLVGPDGIARRQRIQTGLRQHGLVQVLGLPADARVVSTGAGFVKDGERVHVSSQPASQSVPQGASS